VLSGMFELIRGLGLYNNLLGLVVSYLIFTLPFTVWVLTTFMRDLPKELEEAAIMDGATPWQIIVKVFLPLMWPALVATGPTGLHRRLERVPVRAHLHPEQRTTHGAGRHRPDQRRQPIRTALGQHHGSLGHRDLTGSGAGTDLPAAHRVRPDGGRGERLGAEHSNMADIHLRGVCKAFGTVRVIERVDLDIADGEFMVFVGPSGCGKSTLLRLIAGLEGHHRR
jgi:ABC-type multidrug transport system fused ATPase/permease subunit